MADSELDVSVRLRRLERLTASIDPDLCGHRYARPESGETPASVSICGDPLGHGPRHTDMHDPQVHWETTPQEPAGEVLTSADGTEQVVKYWPAPDPSKPRPSWLPEDAYEQIRETLDAIPYMDPHPEQTGKTAIDALIAGWYGQHQRDEDIKQGLDLVREVRRQLTFDEEMKAQLEQANLKLVDLRERYASTLARSRKFASTADELYGRVRQAETTLARVRDVLGEHGEDQSTELSLLVQRRIEVLLKNGSQLAEGLAATQEELATVQRQLDRANKEYDRVLDALHEGLSEEEAKELAMPLPAAIKKRIEMFVRQLDEANEQLTASGVTTEAAHKEVLYAQRLLGHQTAVIQRVERLSAWFATQQDKEFDGPMVTDLMRKAVGEGAEATRS